MIYEKILNDYTDGGYPLDAKSIFVYYGEKDRGDSKVPTLRYVANIDGTNRVSGEIGKEWDLVYVVDETTSPITAKTETLYICNPTETDKVIKLPNVAVAGTQFGIKFVGNESHKVTLQMSTNINGIKNSNSTSLVNSVTIDKKSSLCYVYYFNNTWILTWGGLSFYNNITPYWQSKLISTANTTVIALQNIRYIPRANTTISLPQLSQVSLNFRTAVETEFLGDNTVTVQCASNYIFYNGATVNTITLNKSNKSILITKLDGNWYYAFTNDQEFWVDQAIDTDVTAKTRYRYVCQNVNGLTVNLPTAPKTLDRIGVYVERLSLGKFVKVKCSTMTITGGGITINANDPDGLLIEAPLVYVEFVFLGTSWHIVKLITPSAQREYKAGWGISLSNTDTFNLNGSIDVVDNSTIKSTVVSVDGRNFNQFSVYNIYSRLAQGDGINITQNASTGITTISAVGVIVPTPPNIGTYELVSINGTVQWVTKS